MIKRSQLHLRPKTAHSNSSANKVTPRPSSTAMLLPTDLEAFPPLATTQAVMSQSSSHKMSFLGTKGTAAKEPVIEASGPMEGLVKSKTASSPQPAPPDYSKLNFPINSNALPVPSLSEFDPATKHEVSLPLRIIHFLLLNHENLRTDSLRFIASNLFLCGASNLFLCWTRFLSNSRSYTLRSPRQRPEQTTSGGSSRHLGSLPPTF